MNDLKQLIENELINFNGEVSIYASDLKGHTLEMNSSEVQNPASCIKVFILVELMRTLYFKEKNLTDTLIYEEKYDVIGSGVLHLLSPGVELSVINVATLMMVISDNVATNMMIDYLGIERINQTIREIGCTNTELYGLFDYSHSKPFSKTTASDYALVFEKMIKKELWDSSISDQIIAIMKKGKYHEMVGDGISKTLQKSNSELIHYVATKSGKENQVRNDGGIVSTKYGDYVLCIFIHNFNDSYNANDEDVYCIGRKISNIFFQRYIALQGQFTK